MSVASPVIDSIDATARRAYLKVGVIDYHPLDDIYEEIRNLRRLTEAIRHYDMFVFGGGNVPKNAAGTKRTPRYAIFNNFKVVPDDQDHDLSVTGEQLFMDAAGDVVGEGKDCIDKTLLSVGTDVNIDYEPPGSEVIIVETGSVVTAQDKLDIAAAVRTELSPELASTLYQQGIIDNETRLIKEGDTIYLVIYDANGYDGGNGTPIYKEAQYDFSGNDIVQPADGILARSGGNIA